MAPLRSHHRRAASSLGTTRAGRPTAATSRSARSPRPASRTSTTRSRTSKMAAACSAIRGRMCRRRSLATSGTGRPPTPPATSSNCARCARHRLGVSGRRRPRVQHGPRQLAEDDGPQRALNVGGGDSAIGFSVHDAIAAYRAAGVPANKLVLGVPFYGRSFAGVGADGRVHQLRRPRLTRQEGWYARSVGLRGTMIWDLSSDTSDHALLSALAAP
jgi:hypothetical protein